MTRNQHMQIPAWVVGIRLIRNGIDGIPPCIPDYMKVDDFIVQSCELQKRDGKGVMVQFETVSH